MRGWTRFLETCPSQIVYDSVTKMYDTPFDFSQALSGPVPPGSAESWPFSCIYSYIRLKNKEDRQRRNCVYRTIYTGYHFFPAVCDVLWKAVVAGGLNFSQLFAFLKRRKSFLPRIHPFMMVPANHQTVTTKRFREAASRLSSETEAGKSIPTLPSHQQEGRRPAPGDKGGAAVHQKDKNSSPDLLNKPGRKALQWPITERIIRS